MAVKDMTRERIKSLMLAKPGITKTQIAEELGIAYSTALRHVKAIKAEWEVKE